MEPVSLRMETVTVYIHVRAAYLALTNLFLSAKAL